MRFILPLIFVLFVSCQPNSVYNYNRDWGTSVSSDFSQIVIPYAMLLEKEHRLRFEDSQVYYTDKKIEGLRIIFSTQNILELCEARFLMVDVVEGLLDCLNTNGNLIEGFGHYPITANDLEIYFSFESYFIEYVDPMYIAWMSLQDGIVRFYDGLLKDWRKDFWHERIESYEQSLEFVRIMRAAEQQLEKKYPHPGPRVGGKYINI